MAPQNEMHAESRTTDVEKSPKSNENSDVIGDDLETKELQFEPFSEQDPFRTTRIAEVVDETHTFLSNIQSEAVGFQELNESQLRALSQDAAQRSLWDKARTDAFTGVLRLAKPIPPRANRVL